jgi:hypothetical protein
MIQVIAARDDPIWMADATLTYATFCCPREHHRKYGLRHDIGRIHRRDESHDAKHDEDDITKRHLGKVD